MEEKAQCNDNTWRHQQSVCILGKELNLQPLFHSASMQNEKDSLVMKTLRFFQ